MPGWRLEKSHFMNRFTQREPDTFSYEDSMAISLKRIADSLERIANAEKSK